MRGNHKGNDRDNDRDNERTLLLPLTRLRHPLPQGEREKEREASELYGM